LIVFAYAGKDVNDNVEDNIEDSVTGRRVRDAFNVELGDNNRDRFVEVVSILVIANRIEGHFVDNIEDVSMFAIANKNILGTNNKIGGVLMLIITNRLYLELVLAKAIRKIFFV